MFRRWGIAVLGCWLLAACSSPEKHTDASGEGGSSGASTASGGAGTNGGATAKGGGSATGGGGSTTIQGSFEVVAQGSDALVAISSITGFGKSDVYLSRTAPVLRGGSVDHYDGSRWQSVLDTTYSVFALTTIPGGKLLGSGAEATLLYFDGSSWSEGKEWLTSLPSQQDYVALWATSEKDIYAGHSDLGNVYHYDGTSWRQQFLPTERGLIPIYALWGAAKNDVYASVYQEGLFHFDGAAWTKVTHPTAIISGIHGRSASDIWAVGTQVLHYDGKAWSQVRVADAFVGTGIINQRYHAVWVAPSGKVWIVGEEGVALFGDQSGFKLVPTGVTATLFTVWGSSESDVWAGGELESLVHYTAP